MSKPTGAAVAARAVQAVAEGHTYAEMDCQAMVEYCVQQCGGCMAYAGSNDMARNAVTGLWPLAQAKQLGKLMPGAGLFIHEPSGAEPVRYRADGLGNFSHVGFYVGDNALTDVDKKGNSRVCDCVHSSATMKRVAGSTLKNAWTHVGWFREIEYSAPETAAESVATDGTVSAATAEDTEATDSAEGATAFTASASEAAPADVTGYYTVKRGCKGGAVHRLQTWLGDLGYDLGISGADGDFGAATLAAAVAFQQREGLKADGVIGPKSWAALAAERFAALQASAST